MECAFQLGSTLGSLADPVRIKKDMHIKAPWQRKPVHPRPRRGTLTKSLLVPRSPRFVFSPFHEGLACLVAPESVAEARFL